MECENVNGIFEMDWWLNIVAADSWKEIRIKNEKTGVIEARFAYVIQKKVVKHVIDMPPLTQTLGIYFSKLPAQEYKSWNKQKEIIDKICEQLPKGKNIRFFLHPCNQYVLPFLWNGYVIKPRFTYCIKELSNLEEIFSRFSSSLRRDIRHAEKCVHISFETDVERLYTVIEQTYKSQNRTCPLSYELVECIVMESEKHHAGKMISAIDVEGNIHGCSFFVYDKKRCYYLLSGVNREFRSSCAQSLILWEGIKFASEVSEIFDFEGSMIETIEQFFRKFNAKAEIYYEINRLSLWETIMEFLKPKIKQFIGYKQ